MGKKVQEINAGSMADIAFLLLIFFLVTTTMDTDSGLVRKLPPIEDNVDQDTPPIKKRNVFDVLISSGGRLMVEGQLMDVSQLREAAKEFILNPQDKADLPEKKETTIPFFGNYGVSKGVVSLQNTRDTEYQAYLEATNELVAAYNEVRNEMARSKFGKPMKELNEEQLSAVKKAIPQRISEAEPKNVGK